MINSIPSIKNKNKAHIASRIIFILIKMEKKINLKIISHALGKVETFKKKKIDKFCAIQKIRKRKVQNAFSKILYSHFESSIKLQVFSSSKKLSISVLTQLIGKIQRKNQQFFLKQLQKLKPKLEIAQYFVNFILEPFKSSRSRFFHFFIEKLAQNNQNHIKLNLSIKIFSSLFIKTKIHLIEESFSSIFKYSFYSTHVNHIKIMQNKKIEEKKDQLKRNQQLRKLRLQILTLNKTLQLGQSYKTKIMKQDYQKSMIIQTKTVQNKKITNELQTCNRQNNLLKFELFKLQNYLETRKKSKQENQDNQRTFRNVYEAISVSRETISLRQLKMLLQKKNIDLDENLKTFHLSKQNLMTQNIDLKNIIILHEKQINGFNCNVSINASQIYKKTFEENQNQREVLQNLFIKHLQSTKEIIINKNKLNKILEGQDNSDKGSKITLTTSYSA